MLIGATGWVRYCFGKPDKNKLDLNAYIAHPPQSLNAMILNKAFIRVFLEVWYPNRHVFRLHAQIHDSILFSVKIGHEHLALQVTECMNIPTPVPDITGKVRTLVVPVDLSSPGNSWAACKG
jgi:hypothetical protein